MIESDLLHQTSYLKFKRKEEINFMNIDSIKDGIVIDHIKPKYALTIYNALKLGELDCSVAMITNAKSQKMGRKDIIKIDKNIDLDLDILGFLDSNITINIIKDGVRIEKKHIDYPKEVVNIIKCKNPRCITSIEQELKQVFVLTDKEKKVYRCKYCESVNEE